MSSPNIAKSALKTLDNVQYDLIITDYEMPDMSGLEFVQIIKNREKTKNIPVIVFTSIEKQGLKEAFIKEGVDEFLKKEYFEQNTFLKIINKHLKFSNEQKGE